MTHTRKTSAVLGLATLAALGLAATPSAHAQIAGFGTGSNYTLNHSGAGAAASIASGALQITTAVNDEANSAWYTTPQNISAFNASWTWTRTGSTTQVDADGFSFALQNTLPTALGSGGGGLGYAGVNGTSGVNPNVNSSFATGFEYFNSPYTDLNFEAGVNGTLSPLTDTGISLQGGPVLFTLNYNGAAATLTLNQGTSTYTTTYNVDIPRTINSSTAYVGFTGATGGYNVGQQISNFSFMPVAPTASSPNPTPGLINVTNNTTVSAVNSDGTTPSLSGDGVAANVVDNNYSTKYLNFKGAGSGLIFTKTVATTVKGLSLTSANDAPERDPTSFTFLGSNNGTTFTTIVANVAIPIFANRFQTQYFTFANSTAYTSYELLFPTLSNSVNGVATTANSMQIADVSLFAAAPEPGETAAMLMGGLGVLVLIARKRRVNA